MRRSQTAVLELFSGIPNGPFETEPYEAGWAGEALAFVYVRETAGPNPVLNLRAQISADGQRWIDHGAAFPPIDSVGGEVLAVSHFGNWLRIAGEASGGPETGAALTIDLYWVFKE